ncbi:MAG: hypothetical protein U0235_12365 [Polyangiaceae bacterium]
MKRGEMCGTCHDVGNLRVARQLDGTYAYAPAGKRAPDADPTHQFPLERTFTECARAFADGGVDMQGRFGGDAGNTIVSTCQDCHMPKVRAAACISPWQRADLATHELAGAASWVLGIVGDYYGACRPSGDRERTSERGRDAGPGRDGRIVRERASPARTRRQTSPGTIPTGHIEGRR